MVPSGAWAFGQCACGPCILSLSFVGFTRVESPCFLFAWVFVLGSLVSSAFVSGQADQVTDHRDGLKRAQLSACVDAWLSHSMVD
jgi:hypothetical protein